MATADSFDFSSLRQVWVRELADDKSKLPLVVVLKFKFSLAALTHSTVVF